MANADSHYGWILGGSLRRATGALAAVLVFGLAMSQSGQAQTFKSLYSFAGSPDGAMPRGGVTRDSSGRLYGTTSVGGSFGFGTVFMLSASGQESVLHSFTGGADGATPYGGVIHDAKNNLYGTTTAGGAFGFGIVFKVNPATRQETVLHSFAGGNDGATPLGGLLMDNSGNLYGTTFAGGLSNVGTVYRLNIETRQETILYSFRGDPDGAEPVYGNLIMDSSGNLYGTTQAGGPSNKGTVWELSANGTETVLHGFTGGADGGGNDVGGADQSLTMDAKGNLYGTTERGGVGLGVVFKVNIKTRTETVLYTFKVPSDGEIPSSGLVRDAAGNLYGTTTAGGDRNSDGTVFKVMGKTETVLHRFNGRDGQDPFRSSLLLDGGALYGVTDLGGSSGNGTVWQLTP